jgi:hypothetical protein
MAADREADEEDASTDFDSWGDDESRCPRCFELMTEGSAHRCADERAARGSHRYDDEDD